MAVVGILGHPAIESLKRQPIVFKESKAKLEIPEIRRIGILNLMPNKIQTEIQYLDLFTPASVLCDLVWLQQTTRPCKNVAADHLNAFYQTYAEAARDGLDALIVTGAPIEHLPFEGVAYWQELQEIFEDNARANRPTIYICWAAQAAMYHFHQVPKYELGEKMFGVFEHRTLQADPILEGLSKSVFAPHSRHTYNALEDVQSVAALKPLLHDQEAGVFMVKDLNKPFYYLTGHMEYDTQALHREYQRDLNLGLPIGMPKGYYRNNNPQGGIDNTWHVQATSMINQWLNGFA